MGETQSLASLIGQGLPPGTGSVGGGQGTLRGGGPVPGLGYRRRNPACVARGRAARQPLSVSSRAALPALACPLPSLPPSAAPHREKKINLEEN